jgi:hypothetical protein
MYARVNRWMGDMSDYYKEFSRIHKYEKPTRQYLLASICESL